MLITPEYVALNKELHASGEYGVSGWRWAKPVYSLALKTKGRSVLDYGSGNSVLLDAIRRQYSDQPEGLPAIPLPFRFTEYDPAIPGKDSAPEPAALVVCGDVLEHIEPECLDDVLDDLRRLTGEAVFFVVATRPAKKTLPDGRNAHLIVESARWWLPRLIERWTPNQFENHGQQFIFVGSASD